MIRALLICTVVVFGLAGFGCDRGTASPKPALADGQGEQGAATRPDSRPPQDPASETRPSQDPSSASRPESLPFSRDVPEGSRDPVVDGMKSLIREMILTGFAKDKQPELSDRIVAILDRASLGEDARRKIEAELLSKTLLDVQEEFRPKKGMPAKTELTSDDEQRVRIAAETLARDLYRKLQAVVVAGRHASGQHTAAMRASPTVIVPPGYEAVTWKALGGFEYTEGMQLPEDVRKLNGKKVGIAGYMMTIEEVENIHEFLLVEAFWSCCFGTPPNVNQVLMIKIPGDKGVEYTSSPVLILGTLEVGEEIEDGFVTSVYRIKATSVTATE